MSTHIVLGANGSAGHALTNALVQRGHTTVAVTRSGPTLAVADATYREADLTSRSATDSAIAGGDVVYLAAQPGYSRWETDFDPLLDSVIDAVSKAGSRLVFIDNLYMYAPTTGPISETTPLSPITRKGAIRKRIHQRLVDVHEVGKASVTIVRASDFYGPNAPNTLLEILAIANGAKGRGMWWPLNRNALRSVNYLPDTMRAGAVIGENPDTAGEVWHLPADTPRTGAEWLEAVNEQLPKRVSTRTMPTIMPRMLGLFDADVREAVEIWKAQFARDWVIDASKFRTRFGSFDLTPFETTMKETVGAAIGQ